MKQLKSIRQELLKEGNIKSYSIFLIGEILLVVAGIFVALQIDNWNESRKNTNEAISYLERIQDDLAADTVQLNALINVATTKEAAVKKYFIKVSKRKYSNETLTKYISTIKKRFQKYIPTNDTYEELIASGKVELIDDDTRTSLRKLQQRFEYLDRADEGMITEVMALEIESQKYFDFSYYKKDFALERELISERRRAQGLLIRQNFLTQYSKWMGWKRKN